MEVLHIVAEQNMFDDYFGQGLERARKENPYRIDTSRTVCEVVQTIDNTVADSRARSDAQVRAFFTQLERDAERARKESPGYMHASDGLHYRGERIFNFYFIIDKLYVNVGNRSDNRIDGYRFDLTVQVSHGGKKESFKINRISEGELKHDRFLSRVPYATANQMSQGEVRQHLYKYVNQLLTSYTGETIVIYQDPGWQKWDKDKMVYVDGEKIIGYPQLKAYANSDLRIHNRAGSMNLADCFADMRTATYDRSQITILLLYVLGSFSYSTFHQAGCPLNHCLFLVGSRGNRKTSLALCFSQLGEKQSPKFNFLATESGIQANLSKYKDACMLVDDLAPSRSASKRSESERKLEMMLRLLGDSGERVINKEFADERVRDLEYAAKGGMIITGEYFYSAGVESSIARAIVIDLQSDSVNLQKLTEYQNHPERLETLLYHYILYVSKNWDDCVEMIKQQVKLFRGSEQKKYSNPRYADYMGRYMAIAAILCGMFLKEGYLTNEQAAVLLAEIAEDVRKVLFVNDVSMRTRAPITTILLSMRYMLETNRYILWGEPISDNTACLILREREHGEEIYFRLKDLPDMVRDFCKKTGEAYVDSDYRELSNILVNDGICERHSEGKDMRIGKKYANVYGGTRLAMIPYTKINEKLRQMDVE